MQIQYFHAYQSFWWNPTSVQWWQWGSCGGNLHYSIPSHCSKLYRHHGDIYRREQSRSANYCVKLWNISNFLICLCIRFVFVFVYSAQLTWNIMNINITQNSRSMDLTHCSKKSWVWAWRHHSWLDTVLILALKLCILPDWLSTNWRWASQIS